MHLVETYALSCGAKIDKPLIYEKYFPLPQVKYITFQPFSGAPSKNYDFWQQVIDILFPILQNKDISLNDYITKINNYEEFIDFISSTISSTN